ncbi:hypothetical protein PsorP6_010242 [Peronosclerospora sorghi]|uniref:Uncharacterized protein n=1 Tax=Peronosclerospora sorghi TaxID=230839 RepID=A0ACC0VV29_9STRA|nr:hypothetical protein PsorP6_010242 [Peronosclerospora sorghi]
MPRIATREFEFGLLLTQSFDGLTRQVAHAERMFKPIVRRPWKDVIQRAQLLEIAQALELRRIHERHTEAIQFNVPMDLI